MANPSSHTLTCRNWKLSVISCLKDATECQYAHYDTGVIGPPANVTCWAWKNGGCKLHDEGCLFSHSDTGIVQSFPNTTRRMSSALSTKTHANNLAISMTGKNLAIAKAAAKAGFECSDPERVMTLVNAVRDADLKASYPDYYLGQSRKLSSHHPARNRQRHHYRDLDNPAIPAFTLDATQIVHNIREWGTASFTYQNAGNSGVGVFGEIFSILDLPRRGCPNAYPNLEISTDSDQQPNKRTGTDNYGAGAAKKTKTSNTTHTTTTQRLTVDLTKDDYSMNQQPSGGFVHPARLDRVPGANVG